MHPEIISHFTLIIGIILLLVAVTARKGFAHKIAKKPKGLSLIHISEPTRPY